MHRQLISEKKVFASASPGFLREFSLKLKTIHLPPGDYILYNGDEVDTLYFISRGTIEIVDDRDFILAILGKYLIFLWRIPVRCKGGGTGHRFRNHHR